MLLTAYFSLHLTVESSAAASSAAASSVAASSTAGSSTVGSSATRSSAAAAGLSATATDSFRVGARPILWFTSSTKKSKNLSLLFQYASASSPFALERLFSAFFLAFATCLSTSSDSPSLTFVLTFRNPMTLIASQTVIGEEIISVASAHFLPRSAPRNVLARTVPALKLCGVPVT